MPTAPRVLLILPHATYRAPDFLAAAHALGVDVVVGSDHQAAMGPMGDRSVHLDLARPEQAVAEIVALSRRTPLGAVLAVDDTGLLVATLAAERLGLRHNPLDAVRATRDKAEMRAGFAAAGVPKPAYRVVAGAGGAGAGAAGAGAAGGAGAGGPGGGGAGADGAADGATGAGGEQDAVAAAHAVGWPCVVKPVSLSASRGVIRADDPAAVVAAAGRVRRILADAGEDPEGPLLIERFVPGDEVAVEGLLQGGRLAVLAVFDKPDPLDGPFFEETIYVTPSRHDAATLARVHTCVAEAAAALGLVEGPVHAEARLPPRPDSGLDGRLDAGPDGGRDGGGVVMLEVAARSIGGLCARTLRFGVGATLEELLLRHALQLPQPALEREPAAAGVMMLPIPTAGVLRRVGGVDAARRVPLVEAVDITIAPGRAVAPLPEGDRYLGFLFARGDSPAGVEAALRAGYAALDIDIEPAPPA